jgi:hypothetical protein
MRLAAIGTKSSGLSLVAHMGVIFNGHVHAITDLSPLDARSDTEGGK